MKRVLTGYRPSGKLHLGHLHGNLKNMLELQENYECFFFVADWHALTTEYADTTKMPQYIEEMILDWLAVGLDPQKCVIYRQSDLPEVAELSLYFSMITPSAWLERNPTYKEQLQELKNKEIATHGFLGYPLLQAADILIVHSDLVPVGEDQLPHLELSREIARRFNHFYGNYFKEPQAMLSQVARLPGIDGRKMSKSYNNAIYLTDPPEVVEKKVMKMITDPKKIHLGDPGRPEICTVFALHQIYTTSEVPRIASQCRAGTLACVDDKRYLAQMINNSLESFRQKREELSREANIVEKVLRQGVAKVKPHAKETLFQVRKRMNIV